LDRTLGAPATHVGEGVGEYTGRWNLLQVRTKADPPSSATRIRMDEWGRPISPYPYVVERNRSRSRIGEGELNESPLKGRVSRRSGSSVRGDDTAQLPIILEPQSQPQESQVLQDEHEDEDEAEEREVREMSIGPEIDTRAEPEAGVEVEEDSRNLEEEMEVRAMSMEPDVENAQVQNEEEDEDEEDEEEREVREMSMELDADEQIPLNDTEEYRQRVFTSPAKSTYTAPPSTPSAPPMRDLSFLGTSARRGNQPRVSVAFERAAKLFGTIPTSSSPVRAGPSSPGRSESEQEEEEQEEQVQAGSDDEVDEDAAMDEEMHESMPEAQEDFEDGSDDEDSDFDDPGLVRITSSDPKAAARAAAILKQAK